MDDSKVPAEQNSLNSEIQTVDENTEIDSASETRLTSTSHRSAVLPMPAPQPPFLPDVDVDRGKVVETKSPPARKKYIRRSLANTLDDHTFRSVRLSSPANKTFYDHFLVSTYRDYVGLFEPNEYIDKHRRIDEARLPFRAIVSQVDGCNLGVIEANQSAMQWNLALATIGMFFAFYKALSTAFFYYLSDVDMGLMQTVSLLMWVAFTMFAISMYIFYAYHNWVLESDRFGTGRMFLEAYLSLEREAIFPYKFARNWF